MSDTKNRHTTPRVTVVLDVSHLDMIDVVARPGEKVSPLLRRLLEEEYERQLRARRVG